MAAKTIHVHVTFVTGMYYNSRRLVSQLRSLNPKTGHADVFERRTIPKCLHHPRQRLGPEHNSNATYNSISDTQQSAGRSRCNGISKFISSYP